MPYGLFRGLLLSTLADDMKRWAAPPYKLYGFGFSVTVKPQQARINGQIIIDQLVLNMELGQFEMGLQRAGAVHL